MPPGFPQDTFTRETVRRVNAATGGRVVFEPFSGGEIIQSGPLEWEALIKGTIDAAATPFSHGMTLIPQGGLLYAMVGGLSPVQEYLWYISGDGTELAKRAVKDFNLEFITIGYMDSGEIFMHANKEVKTPADFKGIKMRTSGESGEVLTLMGMEAVWISGGEVYESMQRGVIDACELGGAGLNWSFGLQEVAEYAYISLTRNPNNSSSLMFNKDSWAKIPDDIKLIIKQGFESGATWGFGEQQKLDVVALQSFIDYGTKMVELPKEVEDEFIRNAEIYYDERAAEDPLYADIVKSQREWKRMMEQVGVR